MVQRSVEPMKAYKNLIISVKVEIKTNGVLILVPTVQRKPKKKKKHVACTDLSPFSFRN